MNFLNWETHCSTLRRWRGGQQVEVWEPHSTAIQAVMKLPSGELITGGYNLVLFEILSQNCSDCVGILFSSPFPHNVSSTLFYCLP